MGNEEKLRALLAEAHSSVDPAEGDLFDRIHAALAEPVATVIDWRSFFLKAERERAEARAEVERLKIVLDAVRTARSLLGQLRDHVSDHACDELLSLLSDEPLDEDGNLYLTPSQASYRRGAEAMREAAAQEIERQVDALMMRAGLAADIRDLPVPEGKQ